MALGLALLPTGAARAAIPVGTVGWWTSSPVKPTVAAGGVAVGNAPNGPLTVGAFRIDVGGGASGATLTLPETDGQGQAIAEVQICGAADSWDAVPGGDLAAAPKDTCASGAAPLVRSGDGTSWSATIQSLLTGKTGTVSLTVVPVTGSAKPFQVSFGPPNVGGSAQAAAAPDTTPAVTSAPDTTPVTSSSSSRSSSSVTSSSGSTASSSSGSSGSSGPAFTPPAPATGPTAVAPPTDLGTAPSTGSVGALDAPGPDAGLASSSVPFRATGLEGGGSSGHHTTRGAFLGLFALSLLVGAVAGGFSWAKSNGKLDIPGLGK